MCDGKNTSLAYPRLKIRVEEHISIGVDGEIITIWSKLEDKRK